LWSVTTNNDRNTDKEPRLLSSKHISEWMKRGEAQGTKSAPTFRAGVAPVLELPGKELPIDPYLLGYWLGDGNSYGGAIGVSDLDYPYLKKEVEKMGYKVTRKYGLEVTIWGLKSQLHDLGLLGKGKKHIPSIYLRSGLSQRLSLLQGLMDSDGCSSKTSGWASKFFNTNPDLIMGLTELVRTLGGRPQLTVANKIGRNCGKIDGRDIIQRKPLFTVGFFLSLPCHRLPRKASCQTIKNNGRVRGHYIQSVEPAGLADTVCIQVDRVDGLFLVGEGMITTHNSLLRSMYTSYYFATQIAEIEGIGIERDLAGFPVAYAGDGASLDPSDADSDFTLLKKYVTNIRRDSMEGAVLPGPKMTETTDGRGFLLELLSTGGSRQFDTSAIIHRYHTLMALSAMAQFVFLGMEKVGSYALANVHSEYFNLALKGWADNIADVLNRHAVPRLFALNPSFHITELPQLEHSEAGVPNLEQLAELINKLVGAQVLTPDETLEAHIRSTARLPERMEEEETTPPVKEPEEAPEDELEASEQYQDIALPSKRTRPGGPLFERRTNEYQAALEQMYIDWYGKTAKQLADAEDDDSREELLLAALLLLRSRLVQLGREKLPEAVPLGAGGTPLSPEAWAALQTEVANNEHFIATSLIPAIENKTRLALQDDTIRDEASIGGVFQTFLGRIALYASAFYVLVWEGFKERVREQEQIAAEKGEPPPRVSWVLEDGARHCVDCPAIAGEYENLDELLMVSNNRLPGSPDLACSGNCRCHLKFESSRGWTR